MTLTPTVNIILADDHELFRDGFAGMFRQPCGITLVAEATNGEQLLQQVRKFRPDVVLTDLRMPVMDGVEATRIITKEFPSIAVIGLTMLGDEGSIARMLEAGASGYLNKDATKEEIKKAIQVVAAGGTYYCRGTRQKISELVKKGQFDLANNKMIETFTPTEKRLIQYICEEYTGREIAEMMNIKFRTIEGYRLKLMNKMKVKNQSGLVLFAVKYGLFVPKE